MSTATLSLPLVGGQHVELKVNCPSTSDVAWLRRHAVRLDREQPHNAVRIMFRVGHDIRGGRWFNPARTDLQFTDIADYSLRFTE